MLGSRGLGFCNLGYLDVAVNQKVLRTQTGLIGGLNGPVKPDVVNKSGR